MVTIGFGGGCHWCTEAVFQPLEGVSEVRQGFIRSDGPDEAWSEAVEISFDPDRVSLRDLIAVHLSTHASEADHKMRGKYRCAVYSMTAEQQNACATHIRDLAAEAEVHFVTRSLMHRGECPIFCVSVIWSMLPERSKDDDDFERTAGRTAEGLQAA